MDIAGKVFIVPGGAGGQGEGTERIPAAHSGKVVVADLQVERDKCPHLPIITRQNRRQDPHRGR